MLNPQNNISVEDLVRFTPNATTRLKQIMVEKKLAPDTTLRVGIKGGGCAGIDYLLAFDVKTETDLEFQIGAFQLLIDKTHVMHVVGLTIDYLDEGNSKGFLFKV